MAFIYSKPKTIEELKRDLEYAEKELSKANAAHEDVISSAGMFLLANMERIGKIDCTSFAEREKEALDNLHYYQKYVRELRGELHKLYSAEAQKYAIK